MMRTYWYYYFLLRQDAIVRRNVLLQQTHACERSGLPKDKVEFSCFSDG